MCHNIRTRCCCCFLKVTTVNDSFTSVFIFLPSQQVELLFFFFKPTSHSYSGASASFLACDHVGLKRLNAPSQHMKGPTFRCVTDIPSLQFKKKNDTENNDFKRVW